MSKKETWRTRLYWQIVGGFLIEEFHATKLDSVACIARRLIDGVIIDAKEIGSQVGGTQEIEGKGVISSCLGLKNMLYISLSSHSDRSTIKGALLQQVNQI